MDALGLLGTLTGADTENSNGYATVGLSRVDYQPNTTPITVFSKTFSKPIQAIFGYYANCIYGDANSCANFIANSGPTAILENNLAVFMPSTYRTYATTITNGLQMAFSYTQGSSTSLTITNGAIHTSVVYVGTFLFCYIVF